MADPVTWTAISTGASTAGQVAGKRKRKKAEKEQEKAQRFEWESKQRKYRYDVKAIGQEIQGIQETLKENIGTMRREHKEFGKQQMAAMGAAGATIGTGTPGTVRAQTLREQARDIRLMERQAGREIKAKRLERRYAQEEAGRYEGLLNPPKKQKTAIQTLHSVGVPGTAQEARRQKTRSQLQDKYKNKQKK